MLGTQYRLDLFIFWTVLKEFTISLNLKVSRGNSLVVKNIPACRLGFKEGGKTYTE